MCCGVLWRGVVWSSMVVCSGVVWCGVVCRRRCCQMAMSGVWCLLCPGPIPPDAPDTAAPAGPGWTAPHRGGRNAHRVALVSPSPAPTPPPPPRLPLPLRSGATRPPPRGGRRSGLVGPPHGAVAAAHPGSRVSALHARQAPHLRPGQLRIMAPFTGAGFTEQFNSQAVPAGRQACPLQHTQSVGRAGRMSNTG